MNDLDYFVCVVCDEKHHNRFRFDTFQEDVDDILFICKDCAERFMKDFADDCQGEAEKIQLSIFAAANGAF
jgi:hypothetical protein